MKLFVGIDVSSDKLKVCFMDSRGETLQSFTVMNNLEGASHLRDQILSSMDKHVCTEALIGMESTSVYSWHPGIFLNEDKQLRQQKGKVYVINPKLIKKFKEAYADLPKTDNVDAWIIADRLRFGRVLPTVIAQEQFLALQRLTRTRYRMVRNITREKQYFLQNLYYKCNTFTSEVKSSAHGKAITDLFLEKYSLDEICALDIAELAEYLQIRGKSGFKDPDEVAACIQKAAKSSYRLSKRIEDSVDIVLATIIENIRSQAAQQRELEKAIKRILHTIPNTLQTVPGIGSVLTAGVLAEIGDINRFKNHASVAKYAGLSWSKYQSGKFEAEETNMIRSGNRYLRYYLVEAANSVRQNEAEFGAYYHKKYHEVQKHQHKRALVLTARKLVRLIDTLLRNDQIYTPKRKVTR